MKVIIVPPLDTIKVSWFGFTVLDNLKKMHLPNANGATRVTNLCQHALSKQLVTLNGFSMAADFQPVHEGVISPEQHNDWIEQDDLSAVRGLMLDVRSICVVPASLNAPKWADKQLGPPHLYMCTTARGGRDEDFLHLVFMCSLMLHFETGWRKH